MARFSSPGSFIRDFIQLESSGGIAILIAAVTALLLANTPASSIYGMLLDTTIAVQVGGLTVSKPLLLWVNDGLMAVFFFLIGLEVKREILEGTLSSASQILLPGLAALGGMLVPAGIYAAMNWQDTVALDGWAIPVATDIAFALALLGVFGRRVPLQLKVFLLSLAIFDDLAAILIIAIFYSEDLSLWNLLIGSLALGGAVVLNRMGVMRTTPYILIGIILWVAVLKSGVHATLAGILIAFCIPLKGKNGHSPLKALEEDLHLPVAFAILPTFAFVNAGLSLSGIGVADLVHPVTLGVAAGLFLGKPIGVMLFVAVPVAFGLITLPKRVTWMQILGVSFACGIGFTMSLFIAGLAFEHGSGAYFAGDRLGILIGSFASAIAAYIVLRLSLRRPGHARAQR